MSGAVLSYQSAYIGDYQESAIVNGHPSWINANHAIWFDDDNDAWVVGYKEDLGTIFGGLSAYSQGGLVCPYDIDSTTWRFAAWSGGWTFAQAGEVSITCSQSQGRKNNYMYQYVQCLRIAIVFELICVLYIYRTHSIISHG